MGISTKENMACDTKFGGGKGADGRALVRGVWYMALGIGDRRMRPRLFLPAVIVIAGSAAGSRTASSAGSSLLFFANSGSASLSASVRSCRLPPQIGHSTASDSKHQSAPEQHGYLGRSYDSACMGSVGLRNAREMEGKK